MPTRERCVRDEDEWLKKEKRKGLLKTSYVYRLLMMGLSLRYAGDKTTSSGGPSKGCRYATFRTLLRCRVFDNRDRLTSSSVVWYFMNKSHTYPVGGKSQRRLD